MVEVHHTSKQCSKCRLIKSPTEFNAGQRFKDGLQSYCKACSSASGVEWSRKNRERHRANAKAFYEGNAVAERERSRLWREANRELARQLTKAWEQANPDNVAARAALRRSRIANACPSWSDRAAIDAVYARAAQLTRETGIPHEVDHIIPLAGKNVCGLHVPENLQVIPADENRRKFNKVPA